MTTMTAAQLRAQTDPMEQVPDPEVPERPRPPRRYPAAYKLRILDEYEQLDKAGKGALAAFTAPRGRPPVDPLQRENARLQRENARLQRENARLREQLERARKVIEVQGERSALLDRLANGSATNDSEPRG
jgi:transposase